MTTKDLLILNTLLERTNKLPDILHLRAAPLDYKLTKKDKELLLDTYQKLDDILKEVVAFINVKFLGRQDFIKAWNDIDFDTKIGGMKIITTDREHIKSEWRKGLFDLKSLIKCLKNETVLLIDHETSIKKTIEDNRPFSQTEWDQYFDRLLDKRANQADFFIDMIIEKELIKLDKASIRKYFKKWFTETQDFDLQIENGDFAIENGDFKTMPDFNEDNIPQFLKWFENKGNSFMDYLEKQGVNMKKNSKQEIINHGNMIINDNSKIKKQSIPEKKEQKESAWNKANVLIAFLGVIVAIIALVWGILNKG